MLTSPTATNLSQTQAQQAAEDPQPAAAAQAPAEAAAPGSPPEVQAAPASSSGTSTPSSGPYAAGRHQPCVSCYVPPRVLQRLSLLPRRERVVSITEIMEGFERLL